MAVKDACSERSAISKTERKHHRGQTLLTIPSTKWDRSLFFSFFNPDVSKLQFVCAEVPVYKHASGHRDHVFTTACLEIQHALPHASVSTGLSLAFTGLRGNTFYNCLYYF